MSSFTEDGILGHRPNTNTQLKMAPRVVSNGTETFLKELKQYSSVMEENLDSALVEQS